MRRILEPSSRDKVANLKYLIEQTYKNKELFAHEHYDRRLTPDDILWVGEITPEKNPELSSFFDENIEYMANEEKMKCLEKMELIHHRWECFWKLLSANNDFSFIRDTRDELVHSFNIVTVKAAPMDKTQKMMNLILWFITKLDYIINDNSVTFITRGYGHGVGMSQYGANCMAKEGYSYKDIINHYFLNINKVS